MTTMPGSALILSAAALAVGLGATTFLVWNSLQVHARQLLSYCRPGRLLPEVATIRYKDGGLSWAIDHGAFQRYLPGDPPLWQAVALGAAGTWIVLALGYRLGAFGSALLADGHWVHPLQQLFRCGLAATAILIIFRFALLASFRDAIERRHRRGVETRIDKLLETGTPPRLPPLADATRAMRELSAIQHEIHILCRDLGIRAHASFVDETVSKLNDQRFEIARDPARATTLINAVANQAKRERGNLTRASARYIAATSVAARIERTLRNLPRTPWHDAFDALSTALSSDELKGFLVRRKWKVFFELLDALIADLEAVEKELRESETHRSEHRARGTRPLDEFTVREACRVLGVQESASTAEIKRAFRMLSRRWHPDTGQVSDDRQMKRLSEAYAVLKKAKQFA